MTDERFFIANFHLKDVKITEYFVKEIIGKPFVNENGVIIGEVVDAEIVDEKNAKYTVKVYPGFDIPK